jgi:hypothetical protein
VDFKKQLTSTVAAGALLAFAAPVDVVAGEANLGNDKVNVSLGGRIHRHIVHIDDGFRDGVFHGSGSSGNSELWLSGSGKMTESVTMGAYVRWDLPKQGSSVSFGSTTGAQASTDGANTHKYEYIYFKHASMGTLTLGDADSGANGTMNGNYGSFAADPGVSASATDITTGTAGAFGGGEVSAFIKYLDAGMDTNNRVVYRSPAMGGFSLGADIEQGGGGGAGVKWAGTVSGVSAKAGLGFENGGGGNELRGGSVAIKHPSGIHLALNYGDMDVDDGNESATTTDYETMRIVAGYESSVSSLGKTNVSVSYLEAEDVSGTGDDGESLQIAINQAIDSVGGKIVLQYENLSFSNTAGDDQNDIDVVLLETAFNF